MVGSTRTTCRERRARLPRWRRFESGRTSEDKLSQYAPGIDAPEVVIRHAHSAVVPHNEVFAGPDCHLRIIPRRALPNVRFDQWCPVDLDNTADDRDAFT